MSEGFASFAVIGMCDSLCVMARGRLSRKFAVNEIDADGVMALATAVGERD